jgi:glycosyltransferase involved in cell wall biosynthesis
LQIHTRAKNLASLLRREPRTRALIACSGDFADIPAAFVASRRLNLPFYAYIFDDYVFQWTGFQRWIAKLIAPSIFKHSVGILGPNEFICEEYRRRYGVKAVLVRNPYALEEVEKEPCFGWPAESGKIRLVYTGAVYHANFDCFRNLIQAMRLLSEYPLELHIFTAQTREELENKGIWNERTFVHSHLSYKAALEEQRKADILFIPLAFKSPIPEVIRTSAPGKLGEYLMSGRPILAHVPANSFVAQYFKRYQCGFLVDQNNPQKLALEIKKLLTDPQVYIQKVHNARQQARFDFSPDRAQDQLVEFLQMK